MIFGFPQEITGGAVVTQTAAIRTFYGFNTADNGVASQGVAGTNFECCKALDAGCPGLIAATNAIPNRVAY